MVIDYEGKLANLEEIYKTPIRDLADRFKKMADAESEDESADESEAEAEAVECKKEYRELVKQKKKNAPKVLAKKKSAKRAASDDDEDEDETELEEADDPPKKKPGRKSYNLDAWQKFLHVRRTSMSAPHYGRYVETHDLDKTKPVLFNTVGGIAFKRLDWGQSEPIKYFWKKLDDTDLEDHECY